MRSVEVTAGSIEASRGAIGACGIGRRGTQCGESARRVRQIVKSGISPAGDAPLRSSALNAPAPAPDDNPLPLAAFRPGASGFA